MWLVAYFGHYQVARCNMLALLLFVQIRTHSCKASYPKLHGTKTTYADSFTIEEATAIGMKKKMNNFQNTTHFYPSFCKPIHLSMVFRHGIRSPSLPDIDNIGKVHQKILNKYDTASSETKTVLENFTAWKSLFPRENAKKLVDAGSQEIGQIASRLYQRYNELLSSDPDFFTFVSSNTHRTIESAKAFTQALNFSTDPEIKIRNDLIRFFDKCVKYITEVEENPDAVHQSKLFKDGTLFEGVWRSLESKLGVKLTSAEIKSIYVTAAMEEAVNDNSIWSDLLDQHDLNILQYAKDIKTYWKKGYGHEINYIQSCPLLSDIFSHLEDGKNLNRKEKGAFWFGHAETLLPLMCILGLYKDSKPLRSDNFAFQQDRQFKTNRFLSFSSNIGILLLDCDVDKAIDYQCNLDIPGWRSLKCPPSFSRYMVQLLVKELPHPFPFSEYDIFSYSEMKEHYQPLITNCDLHTQCSVDKHLNNEL